MQVNEVKVNCFKAEGSNTILSVCSNFRATHLCSIHCAQ